MEWNKVIGLNALEGIKLLPDNSVQSVITSPPYFRQRDYGVAGQWGQEPSMDAYVDHLIELFREVRRALKDDGTVWIVLGDSYSNFHSEGRGHTKSKKDVEGPPDGVYNGCKRKDLLGVPWMVAFALRKDGWYFRQDIVWFKTNPMPESVQDRCTRSHEYIFMFAKRQSYYYDNLAIATPLSKGTQKRLGQNLSGQRGSNRVYGKKNGPMKAVYSTLKEDGHGRRHAGFNARWLGAPVTLANRRSVWPIATAMSKEDHFASYPSTIPELCIKASTRENDVVVDPFAGTGTTLLQASILGRRYIGFDLNPKYVAIARKRLKRLEGLFFKE